MRIISTAQGFGLMFIDKADRDQHIKNLQDMHDDATIYFVSDTAIPEEQIKKIITDYSPLDGEKDLKHVDGID